MKKVIFLLAVLLSLNAYSSTVDHEFGVKVGSYRLNDKNGEKQKGSISVAPGIYFQGSINNIFIEANGLLGFDRKEISYNGLISIGYNIIYKNFSLSPLAGLAASVRNDYWDKSNSYFNIDPPTVEEKRGITGGIYWGAKLKYKQYGVELNKMSLFHQYFKFSVFYELDL